MPESRTRKEADEKKKLTKSEERAKKRAEKAKAAAAPGKGGWVVPTFITVGLLGVLWLVVYYVTASAGIYVPWMSDIGGWNILIGMGLMAASFVLATFWK
ncbi:MAG: cell division protein CrgA [Propionibacteriaceae bacterium]|nr:cell division protein CrgA [Propionibacteriaceae bacterium]